MKRPSKTQNARKPSDRIKVETIVCLRNEANIRMNVRLVESLGRKLLRRIQLRKFQRQCSNVNWVFTREFRGKHIRTGSFNRCVIVSKPNQCD